MAKEEWIVGYHFGNNFSVTTSYRIIPIPQGTTPATDSASVNVTRTVTVTVDNIEYGTTATVNAACDKLPIYILKPWVIGYHRPVTNHMLLISAN
jgi:hypothetical protein